MISTTTKTAEQDKRERAEIDASTRVPVILFYGSAVFWLLVGSLFALLASFKMNNPHVLDQWGWLTFGRVRPAHLNAVAYGWLLPPRSAPVSGSWRASAACPYATTNCSSRRDFWNLGVLLGTLGLLAGDGRSIEWLEFPNYASGMLFVAYGLIAVWAVIMFRFRQPGHVYVSQWYILAALHLFPVALLHGQHPPQPSTRSGEARRGP